MTDTKHAGTPRCPKCGSGEIFLFITECITRCPSCHSVYPTIKIADFMQFSPLAEENALRTNKLAEILRLEVDGEEFYIPAEPGPLGPFESLEEAAKEFMEFMDRTDKKMREENALLRKALEITLKLLTEEVFSSSEQLVQRCAEVGSIVRDALEKPGSIWYGDIEI